MEEAVKEKIEITSWEDVNAGLRRMGECKLAIIRAATIAKKKADVIQEAFDVVKIPNDAEYKELESAIEAYAEAHKTDCLGKKTRTKKLSFGAVSFKLSAGRVEFTLAPELVIANLKAQGHADCVRDLGEEVNKDAVQNVDKKDLLKAGIKIEQDDNCSVKPDLKKIQEEVTA